MMQAMFALAVPDSLFALDGWLLRTTLAGGIVLLIGSLWMLLTRQPAQRQRIGELALLAALLVALPAALPAWWSLPGTEHNSSTTKALFGRSLPLEPTTRPLTSVPELFMAKEAVEDDEADADIVTFLQTIQHDEKETLKSDAGINKPEKTNDNDVKGLAVPTSLSALRWTLRIFGLAYLGLAIALLIRCSVGYYGLWRYWQKRRPAPAHVHAILAELEPDVLHRPRIGVNHLVHGPVSYGLWKQTILLPPHFCNEGDPDKLRWILAHELTHLRRRDAWGCLLLALGGALYFHVPWFWWMKRHVRLAQEYLADAAAVKIANAVEYAQYLVSLTSLTSRPTLASSQAVGVFESPSDLYRRVHMLLHQRSVLERTAPRWWTLTAAASFLTLAACTSGIKLYADEPEIKTIEVVVVSDDDEKSDKKKEKKATVTVNGKVLKADGKDIVIVTDDDNEKPKITRWQGQALLANPKLDEAMKKLDQALEKLPKLDGETRAQLEELKKSLKAMKEGGGNVFFRTADPAASDGRVRVFGQLDKKNSDEDKQRLELRLKEAHQHAQVAQEHAKAEQARAKQAQELALTRWKDAKDGKDRDAAIKALEEAIIEKERALKALKEAEATPRVARLRALNETKNQNSAVTSKGRLGVVVAEIDSTLRSHLDLADGQGLMLQEVIDPSPAWNQGNGLRSSDILLELGGKKVPSNPDQFRELVGKLNEGTINAVVLRKGKKLTIGGIKLPGIEKVSRVVMQGDPVTTFDIAPKVNFVGELAVTPQVKVAEGHDMVWKVNPIVHGVKLADVKADNVVNLTDRVNHVAVGKPLHVIASDVHVSPHVDMVTTTTSQQQGASKPRLGVMLDAVPEIVASQIELSDDRGLLVTEVVDGTPAQKAGFLKNDILIEFADKPVARDHSAFTRLVKEMKPGKYTATVIRKGKEIRIRDIQIADPKVQEDERKAKAKAWEVEGDARKEDARKEKVEKEEVKNLAKRQSKKEKEDFFPNANRGFALQRDNGTTSVNINNGEFKINNTNEGKTITINGKMVEGKAKPSSITIKADGEEKKYKAIKEVPEEDQAQVEKLLSSVKGNVFQWKGNAAMNFDHDKFNQQMEQQMKVLEKQLKQLGDGGAGLEQMEKQLEEVRQQLRKLRGGKGGDDN